MPEAYDIVLVNPTFNLLNDKVNFSNAGLGYLESYLHSKGIRCVTIDSDEVDTYRDRTEVFGISVIGAAYDIARKLSRRLWDKTVIWGGGRLLFWPRWLCKRTLPSTM